MLMNRFVPIGLTVLFAVAPLAAQGTAGWKVRVDRSTNASDPDAAGDVKFMAMGSGFHAVNPQAAVFWKPGDTATGSYSLKGRFTQLKVSDHTNYFGLVFGGSDLEGAQQSYVYFVVAQDGTWLIKRRNGDTTEDVAARSTSPAVRKPNPNGQSTNDLEVRVTPDTIVFSVNGTTVHTMPKSGLTTDGTYGFRVNHRLEVQVDDFGVS
jgi:hypothetical protein